MILHRDNCFPALPLRRFCTADLQTSQELYLATIMELRAQTSRTIPLSITVTRASDGKGVDYSAISAMRRRKDGTVYHRVTVRNVGGYSTISEAARAVLAYEAAQQESRKVSLTNPVFEPATVALRAGGL